jgi:hypothetical protein
MSTAQQSATEPRLTSLSHGGGCGCKIAPGVLSDILKGMPAMPMPRELMVGIETADDAAVYRLNDEQALIATTDFFMPIVDDPYDFGRIAATNAISDVYAMGGRPIMALALVGMPINVLSTATIGRILEGGASVCRDAGIPVAGGHTIDSVEAIYGLVAMGLVHPDRVRRNADARPGDVLVLGKPLGVGVMSAALKKGAARRGGLRADDRDHDEAEYAGPGSRGAAGRACADRCDRLRSGRSCAGTGAWREMRCADRLVGRALARRCACAGGQGGFVTGASGSQLGWLRRARGAARRFRRRGQGLADRPADQRRSARGMRSGQCRTP